MKFRKVY